MEVSHMVVIFNVLLLRLSPSPLSTMFLSTGPSLATHFLHVPSTSSLYNCMSASPVHYITKGKQCWGQVVWPLLSHIPPMMSRPL